MNSGPLSQLLVAAFLWMTCCAVHAGEKPDSYVDRHGWLGVQLDQSPLEGGGIRIESVVSGGPANRAGLRNGDIILAIAGEKIETFEALARLISGTEPGTSVEFDIRRRDTETKIPVVLGHRRMALGPMIEGGRENFPSNALIHPEWTESRDEFSGFLIEVLERNEKAGLYRDLVQAFTRDEDLFQTFFKLNETSYVRREPLKLPRSARALTDDLASSLQRKDRMASMLRRGALLLDAPGPGEQTLPATSPGALIEGLAFARGLVDRALSGLSGGERAFLYRQSRILFTKFKEHIYLKVNSSDTMYTNNLEAIRLAKKIDYTLLFMAGETVARHAEAVAALPLDAWNPEALGGKPVDQPERFASGDVTAVLETEAGVVILGGPGRTVYTGEAALIIDVGGDDLYLNQAGGSTDSCPVAVVIDLEGDDTYRGGSCCQGTGRLGVGVLLDLEGDDRYDATDFAQGCGLFGVGLLLDAEGDDRYHSGEYHAGAGLFGIGVLVDLEGRDRYAANLYSQGFGATKGLGLLLDAGGDDSFYASGKYPSGYGTPGVYRGMSQGFGIGFRMIAAGGVGVLLDLGGNDHYVAGNFSQGGGYFMSYGILRDRKGDDRYDASRYNQGFGVHSASGILIDDAGNDRYRSEVAANQGSAWDLGVGYLIDGGGNDRYEAHGLAQGGASQNGFAVLLDLGGKDDYHARGGGQGLGGQTTYGGGRGAKNLGILVDAGGAKDSYNRENRANDRIEVDGKGGVFADLKGSPGAAFTEPEKIPGPEKKSGKEEEE